MRRLPPHGKEKCGSPRVTLRLHQLKEKKKDKLNSISEHDNYNCRGMDSVNKNGNTTNDDGSNKEQAGGNCDENGNGPNGGEHKENNASSGTTGVTPSNQSSTAVDSEHHHHSSDGTSTAGATVKRSHSTDEDDDTKKKRRKDEGGRGKSGSNSGGSPKSLIGVESEGEDAKSVESPGPKVPPLKIVIAGASLEEPGTGGRNGKNGSGRHHLPYVVSTTATTSTNSSSGGATSASTNNNNTNNNSNNSNNSTSNSNTTVADTGTTNVGSSGDVQSVTTSEEPVGPKSPADEPVTSPSGSTGTATGRHQRVLRSHRSSGGGSKEDRGNGSSGHPSPAGVTLSESGSPRLVEGGSPSPSVGESVGGNQSGIGSSNVGVTEAVNVDDKGGNGNTTSANNSANSSVNVEVKVSGNSGSSTTVEEPVTTSGSQTSTTSGQVQATSTLTQPSSISSTELHPRKRKMRPKDTSNNNNNLNTSTTAITTGNTSPATTTSTTTAASGNLGQTSPGSNVSSANGGANGVTQSCPQNGSGSTGIGQTESSGTVEPGGPSSNLQHLDQSVTNSYQLFLNIRKQIERKRKGLFPVQPKPPQGFKDYLMNRCTYVLASNASNRVPPPNTNPPANLHPGIKDLYIAQEKERHRLLMQHVIEKEKLVLSVEQEILRVHGRAARALANQALPFSACTILRDEEVYSAISPEQEEKDRNQARSRYNGRLFLSWLQDVDDKWEKIKEAMLVRHHNEAESLHAVQKMDWEWKMKELGICEMKSNPVIEETHVPMVHVSDDFDLLPA
ncbi:hypothetical protein O3M35_002491 [Rhynocoris fuscipes]|uniref:Ankyrin repeat domain-containing protein 12 n=1 Tax=Rhynocoris fuscipes TaxID=488301 RepID=A0AAW1CLL3_9HEMI